MKKPRVLALNVFYLPGYRGGGSIRALVNVAAHLRDDFEFVILTVDHDLGTSEPYSDADQAGTITAVGYDIRYFHGALGKLAGVLRSLREPWDLIYLNSSFSPYFSIWPLLLKRFGLAKDIPVVLAPRGELMRGALQSKHFKKMLFLTLARICHHYAGLLIHATSADEAAEFDSLRLGQRNIMLARDLPPAAVAHAPRQRKEKRRDELALLFVSRIDRKKNLLFALQVLQQSQSTIIFDIVGPIADETYWSQCKEAIRDMPSNITVNYVGSVPYAELPDVYASHDLLFFPTLGENNGYVIPEALIAGCPVLISDLTPWRDLEAMGVGEDKPLSDPQGFATSLDAWTRMNAEEHRCWSDRAHRFGLEKMQAREDVEATRNIFLDAMRRAATS